MKNSENSMVFVVNSTVFLLFPGFISHEVYIHF